MTTFPDHPFWDFSLQTYGAEGVAPACLALQEGYRVDVNFLLFCLWLGRAGYGAVGADEIARMHGAIGGWHKDVVRHLRTLRKRLKTPVATEDRALALSLRQRIQKIEIDAEHIEQLMLGAALPDPNIRAGDDGDGAAAARANLEAYFVLTETELDESGRGYLEIIIAAAFPGPNSAR